MRKAVLSLALFLALLLSAKAAISAEGETGLQGVDIKGLAGSIDLGNWMQICRDPAGKAGIAEAAGGELGFAPPVRGKVNFGYSGGALWARLRIFNSGTTLAVVLLEFAYPAIDYVTLFRPEGAGYTSLTLGDQTPFSRRAFESRNPVFPIRLAPGEDVVLYLRASSSGNIEMPLRLWAQHALGSRERDLQLVFGLVFGLILAMGLYNFFLFISVKDSTYIAYLVFTLGLALGIATLRGFTYELVFPEGSWLANAAMPFSLALCDIGGLLFAILFLKARREHPVYHMIMVSLIAASCLIAASSFILPYSIILPLADIATFVIGVATILAGLVVHKRSARYFTAAWIALVAGTVVTFLHAFGLIQPSFASDFGMEIGSCTQVVLLSFSLADKLNLAQREKQEVQRRAAAEALESRRRIAELDRLKTLGVLAAGVAHEINTPNNAVIRNLPIVSEVWREISPIVDRFMADAPGSRIGGWNAEELKAGLPELISDTYAAGIQIRKIVEDLKDFARDSGGMPPGPVSLAAVVSYAARLLAPMVAKKTRHFSLEIEDELPEVVANFQKLTQVAVNILENALQSLPSPEAAVRIRVFADARRARVCIECIDKGSGIESELRPMIFEPFFTTKRDSGGMGLGLSVAYGIVRECGGDIELLSTKGDGTTVRVFLPAIVS